jgi:hypothetical protein
MCDNQLYGFEAKVMMMVMLARPLLLPSLFSFWR